MNYESEPICDIRFNNGFVERFLPGDARQFTQTRNYVHYYAHKMPKFQTRKSATSASAGGKRYFNMHHFST